MHAFLQGYRCNDWRETCSNCGVVLLEKAVDLGRENMGQMMDEYNNNSRTGQKT